MHSTDIANSVKLIFEDQLAGYGESKPILSLKEAGHIVQGNSCRKDWKEVCPITKEDEVYVIGNLPYQGSRKQNKEQKEDLRFVFRDNYLFWEYEAYSNVIAQKNLADSIVSSMPMMKNLPTALPQRKNND